MKMELQEQIFTLDEKFAEEVSEINNEYQKKDERRKVALNFFIFILWGILIYSIYMFIRQ